MRLKFFTLTLLLLALALPATAGAQALPDSRTHVDSSAEVGAVPAGTNDDDAVDSPRLTLLRSATTAKHVKQGYLVVQARCNLRCEVEIVATAKIGGKKRDIASTTKTLRANKTTTIKLKIRSDVRREIQAGRGFTFEGTPTIALD
jgi:hypothetical protein